MADDIPCLKKQHISVSIVIVHLVVLKQFNSSSVGFVVSVNCSCFIVLLRF